MKILIEENELRKTFVKKFAEEFAEMDKLAEKEDMKKYPLMNVIMITIASIVLEKTLTEIKENKVAQ